MTEHQRAVARGDGTVSLGPLRRPGDYDGDASDAACTCARCGSFRPGYPYMQGDPCLDCGCTVGRADESGACEAPHVCPGCHAVGEERCAPGCIDAELDAEHRHAIESGDYDRTEEE